jgi:predicted Rdx family selenoprotein
MPKFLIERNIPGIEGWNDDQMRAVARKSNQVLSGLGTQIQWLHSYVVAGKLFCVYIAPDEQLIREHAKLGGFPANNVIRIEEVIDPTTAETTA